MRALPALVCCLCACGGSSRRATAPGSAIGLTTTVQSSAFYRARATCSQGPFELELPVGAAKYGEQVELLVRTPRRIALHAVIASGDAELASVDGVFDPHGRTSGRPDNARCIADARERLAAARGGPGGGTGGGGAATTGDPLGPVAPGAPAVAVELEPVTDYVVQPTQLLVLRIPDSARAHGRVRIRLWSIEPNDLDGVVFGITHVVWRPNVPEAEYEAHLIRLETERQDAARREAERRAALPPPRPVPVRAIDPEEQRRRDAAERERAERRARAERDRQARSEAKRIADERAAAARAQFCASHPDDRGCWGPGGLKIHLELQARRNERASYCAAHREDARCWTDADRERIRADEQRRMTVALNPPKPSGPPPAPLAETTPPKLSANAEWRPGYWQWVDSTWVWLAGMWRVPDADIVAEQTTTAPSAPPALRVEAPPPPPVRTAVWIPGFWQWDGTTWIWIAGSYQLRPTATLTWRAAAWQPRGSVHVLVPGGWVRIGGGR